MKTFLKFIVTNAVIGALCGLGISFAAGLPLFKGMVAGSSGLLLIKALK